MTEVEMAYDAWAEQYDTNKNRTRDLEAVALRSVLNQVPFTKVLETGCGTGKNTTWFLDRGASVTAVDLSAAMMELAKQKAGAGKVEFYQADITREWDFRQGLYDLVSFSLVLEHIRDLDPVLRKAAASLVTGGHVYIGELHPFKQYTGTRARFDTKEGKREVECYNHHISEFFQVSRKHGLQLVDLGEHFDEGEEDGIPRILTMVLKKI